MMVVSELVDVCGRAGLVCARCLKNRIQNVGARSMAMWVFLMSRFSDYGSCDVGLDFPVPEEVITLDVIDILL
jgi:hypothetical protein